MYYLPLSAGTDKHDVTSASQAPLARELSFFIRKSAGPTRCRKVLTWGSFTISTAFLVGNEVPSSSK